MMNKYSITLLISCALFSASLSADSLSSMLTKYAEGRIQDTLKDIESITDNAPPNTNTNTNKQASTHKKSYAHTKLSNFNLSGKDLSGVNFQHSRLENFNFSYANLSGANFAHATLINCDLRSANINNVDFSYTKFEGQSKIAGLDFSSADMSYSKLDGADSTTQLGEVPPTTLTNKDTDSTVQLDSNYNTATTFNQEIETTKPTVAHKKHLVKACNEDCRDVKRQDMRDCYQAYGAPAPWWKVEKNPNINNTINACTASVKKDFFNCKSACKSSPQPTASTIDTTTQEIHTASTYSHDTTKVQEKSYAHTTLSNMNFSNKDLQNTDFSYTTLNNITFKNTDLTGANFKYSKMNNVNFQGANLQNTAFDHSKISSSDLRGSIVTNSSFIYVKFLNGTKLAGVDFSTSDMQYAKMKGADFDTPLTISSKNIERVLTQKPKNQSGDQKSSINLAIQFEFDSSQVKQESMPQLNEVATALQSQSLMDAKIMVEGHTDAIGNTEYNQQLSEERASSVQYILTNNYGIDYGRVYILGFGEKRPISSNNTDYGRAQNRRVTITNLNS